MVNVYFWYRPIRCVFYCVGKPLSLQSFRLESFGFESFLFHIHIFVRHPKNEDTLSLVNKYRDSMFISWVMQPLSWLMVSMFISIRMAISTFLPPFSLPPFWGFLLSYLLTHWGQTCLSSSSSRLDPLLYPVSSVFPGAWVKIFSPVSPLIWFFFNIESYEGSIAIYPPTPLIPIHSL